MMVDTVAKLAMLVGSLETPAGKKMQM